MKASEIVSILDIDPLKKYGAKIMFTNGYLCLDSPICQATFGCEEIIPEAVVLFSQVKTAFKHLATGKVTVMDNKFIVRDSSFRLTVPILPDDEFAFAEELDVPEGVAVITKEMADHIEKCLPYTSEDISQPNLCAVHIKDGWMESTNRASFLRVKTNIKNNVSIYNSVIAPLLLALSKIGEVAIWQDDSVHMVGKGFFCKAPIMAEIKGAPDINQILTEKEHFEVDVPIKEVFSEAKKIVDIAEELGNDKSYGIQVKAGAGKIIISCANQSSEMRRVIACPVKQEITFSINKDTVKTLPQFLPDKMKTIFFKLDAEYIIMKVYNDSMEFYTTAMMVA